MTSEIRVNKLTNRIGLSTVTFADSGIGVTVTGNITSTGTITGEHHGDGSNLTGIAGVSISSQGNNRLITCTGTTDSLTGESSLTYDGTTLQAITSGSGTREQINLKNQNASAGTSRINFFSTVSGTEFACAAIRNGVNTVNKGRLFLQTNQGSGLANVLELDQNGNVTVPNGKVSISSDGTIDGILTIKGDTDQVGTPSIRLLDGSDTREVSISNTSGDFVASVHGNDNAIHGHIKMFESGIIDFNNGGATGSNTNRLRIATDGRFGFNTSSPSDYALATFNSANGILLQGDGQSRILMRNNTAGTNQKMMDIQCDGNINFRTINDNYTTATTRATFRTDGNFVVGNRVGLSAPSTNQPVAFHSARITPDGMTSTVSNGVRCNLYVGSNSGWQAGDGGVIGMGGSRSGSPGQEAIWSYIKGSRQSGNGWEYAGRMELGTTEWGTYNMTKAMTIYADNQVRLHGDDNTMMTFDIGGATRLVIEHTGGGNMRLRNASSGTVTYQTSSDYRLKENATTIDNALSTVKALKPYQFTWKHDNKLGQGFFAHEAQAVLPDIGVVSGTKDEVQLEDDTKHDGQWKKDDPIYQSVDYSKLVPLLTAALQEETAKREALEARVAALEGS